MADLRRTTVSTGDTDCELSLLELVGVRGPPGRYPRASHDLLSAGRSSGDSWRRRFLGATGEFSSASAGLEGGNWTEGDSFVDDPFSAVCWVADTGG